MKIRFYNNGTLSMSMCSTKSGSHSLLNMCVPGIWKGGTLGSAEVNRLTPTVGENSSTLEKRISQVSSELCDHASKKRRLSVTLTLLQLVRFNVCNLGQASITEKRPALLIFVPANSSTTRFEQHAK